MKELEKDMTLLRSGMKECGREARGQMMRMTIRMTTTMTMIMMRLALTIIMNIMMMTMIWWWWHWQEWCRRLQMLRDSCDSSKTDSHEQQKNPRNKIFPSKNPLERIENKQRPKRKPGKGKTRKRELVYCGDQGWPAFWSDRCFDESVDRR